MIVSVLRLWESKAEQKFFKIKEKLKPLMYVANLSVMRKTSEDSAVIVKVGSKQSEMLACDVPLTVCAINWAMHTS